MLSTKMNILDVWWPLLFFPETDFIYNYLHIVQNEQKINVGSFCRQDIKSCYLVAARCVKLIIKCEIAL